MKLPILLVVLLSFSTFSKAQDQKREVKILMEQFFQALNARDTLALKNMMMENTRLETVIDEEGVELRSVSKQDFFLNLARARDMHFKEEVLNHEIRIDDPMAMIWAPYRFILNGQPGHCGVNLFTLIHTETGWKIYSILDTRHKKHVINR